MSEQIKSGQQRLPLTNIQNKGKTLSENVKMSKTFKTHTNINEEDNSVKKDCVIPDSHIITEEEENIGNHHHYLSVQKALKEAIDENDKLREQVEKLILENKELKKEIDEKDEALIELSEHYQHCITNHMNKDEASEKKTSC